MSNLVSRLYNPTPYNVVGKFDGIAYDFKPGSSRTLPEEAAWWIMDRFAKDGLVNIDPPDDKMAKNKVKYQSFVVRKALEGLEACLNTAHSAAESFVLLDTELKQANQHGTVLKCKALREITTKIENLTHLIADIEKKHGVSIAKQDYEEKAKTIMSSIEDAITAFEADEEVQKLAEEEESRINKVLREIETNITPPPLSR